MRVEIGRDYDEMREKRKNGGKINLHRVATLFVKNCGNVGGTLGY